MGLRVAALRTARRIRARSGRNRQSNSQSIEPMAKAGAAAGHLAGYGLFNTNIATECARTGPRTISVRTENCPDPRDNSARRSSIGLQCVGTDQGLPSHGRRPFRYWSNMGLRDGAIQSARAFCLGAGGKRILGDRRRPFRRFSPSMAIRPRMSAAGRFRFRHQCRRGRRLPTFWRRRGHISDITLELCHLGLGA